MHDVYASCIHHSGPVTICVDLCYQYCNEDTLDTRYSGNAMWEITLYFILSVHDLSCNF